MSDSVKQLWEGYLATLECEDKLSLDDIEAWHFCSNKKDADDLAQLVLEGTKRATAYLFDLHEIDGDEIAEIGELNIITDWDGNAKCITRVTKVQILPFKDVTEEMAFIEGEGDKSLEYWRDEHIKVFSEEMKGFNKEFTEDMKIVFEEFEVVYK